MDKELFYKYLTNKCQLEELNEVFNWFKDSADGLYSHNIVKQFWNEYLPSESENQDERLEIILDKVHHRINLLSSEKNFKSEKTRSGKPLLQKIIPFLMRAAAVLFIPLLLILLYTWVAPRTGTRYLASDESQNIEISAPVGSRTYVELPDGTGVHLNHGSKLAYPRIFKGRERKVELTGEAYFTVTNNANRSFKVYTENIIITAMGTEFNVMAYPKANYTETTLIEGKVLVQKQLSDQKIQTMEEMDPGHHLRYNAQNNSYTYSDKEDISKYISWKDGLLIFKDDSFDEIISRLSRWYNVEFILKNDLLNNYTYTATFMDETLPQIMELLEMATPIKYEITPRIKQFDGTFTKQKVIIDLKL
jgi:transmembrane sensor